MKTKTWLQKASRREGLFDDFFGVTVGCHGLTFY